MRKSLLALSVGCATIFATTPAAIAETMPDFETMARAAYQSQDGKEIEIEGAVGTQYGDRLYFYDASGRFPILLDAGRAARKSLEGCEINSFMEPSENPCLITGKAEVQIDWDESKNFADGIKVRLVVFELTLTRSE
ncbi:MAG: hypothetical protein N4A53_00930 [Pelagimonas sp.]|jgi:hypothetical protein|nr:hypothetical protein [Pelagimonas sp.]